MKPARLAVTCLIALASSLLPQSAGAAVIDVEPTLPDTDCSDLVCNFQAALDYAGSNAEDNTIRLLAGEWSGEYDTLASFVYSPSGLPRHSLTIEGSGIGRSIINGGAERPGLAVRIFPSTDTPTFTLRGVTIRGGGRSGLRVGHNRVIIENCSFAGNSDPSPLAAGGVTINSDAPGGAVVVRNSLFSGNTGFRGGGLLVATFGDVTVEGNAVAGNQVADGGAGGVYVKAVGLNTVVRDNRFQGNSGGNQTRGGGFTSIPLR